jgi:drug/metabolite transporter (DMT)-like permease
LGDAVQLPPDEAPRRGRDANPLGCRRRNRELNDERCDSSVVDDARISGELAGVSWGYGTIVLNRRRLPLDPIVVSGWQQLAGGIGFAAAALMVGEPLPQPTPAAWAAWTYLMVVGSLVAFSCFVYALKVLPTSVVMTYAYVNPAIAVVLGWLILDESITGYTLLGMALILAGVYGVFHDRMNRRA